ncbi:MAG: glycoside hydrolase family 28 protein, partial [Alistipes sp.]|nr:glycoside hydrolase family 28 protein [Alistipes sp.]
MKRFTPLLLGMLTLATAAAQAPCTGSAEELPFAMPQATLPTIPEREVSIADFGGDPSGARLSTE